jgi:hypothetical protein
MILITFLAVFIITHHANFALWEETGAKYKITRKYMHAKTLADKTIVFSEPEVFKVVVMVTQ